MKETASAGGVVLNSDGLVLVVGSHGRVWSLPKDHIEREENSIDAVRRFVEETVGIENLNYVRPLGCYQRFRIAPDGGEDIGEHKTIEMFLFHTEEIADLGDSDNPKARWVSRNEVVGLLTNRKDKDFFECILPDLPER